MPTYQYECEACSHGFEQYQTMTEAKLKKCPKCGKQKLVRLIGSGNGIIFKGTGFYETDYKPKGAGAADSKKSAKASPAPAKSLPAGRQGCGSGCGCH